jgi:glucosamine kinase
MDGPPVYLGIDAGGTASRWVLLSQGEVLARGDAPPFSGHIHSEAELTLHLGVLQELLRVATEIASPQAVTAGITGLNRQTAYAARFTQLICDICLLQPQQVRVDSDISIAYASAFRPGEGVLVYAGTGSIGYFETPAGAAYRSGGYGYVIDDAGGGFWLGREALKQTLRWRDEFGDTVSSPLAAEVYRTLGTRDWPTISQKIYSDPRRQLANLAPAVVRAAQRGDRVATALLEQAGTELARLALTLFKQLGQVYPVALAGGTIRAGSYLTRAFERTLPSGTPVTIREADAALAAARLAAMIRSKQQSL